MITKAKIEELRATNEFGKEVVEDLLDTIVEYKNLLDQVFSNINLNLSMSLADEIAFAIE